MSPPLRRDLGSVGLGLLLLLAWDASGADLPLSRLFGSADGFAWRHLWLFEGVLHDGAAATLRWAFVLLGLNVLWPLPLIGALPRSQRLRWWLMSLLCALLVSLIKHRSLISCPWSLAEFGGAAHTLSHWSLDAWWGAGDGGPGGCFPAGHVSNAFGLVGGALALREVSRRAARVWLAGVCGLGLVLGLTQLVRGAHYASHSLWTAWLCWGVSVLFWHATAPRPWRAVRLRPG